MSGLRDAAAACVIVGGMLVGGPGVAIAAAHPDHGEHHGGEGHGRNDRDRDERDRAGEQTGGTGNGVDQPRPVSTIRADGSELATGQPGRSVDRRAGGAPPKPSVQVGRGADLRGGVDVGDGVRIGGGVRVGPDLSALQSLNPNATRGQPSQSTSTSVPAPQAAPRTATVPNAPTSVQPRRDRLGFPAAPGGVPSVGSAAGIPPLPSTPPMPVPEMPPVPPLPPEAPAPFVVPPPAAPPTAGPPSALPNGPSLPPEPAAQTPPPPPNAPLTSIAPQSRPGGLPYRAGYSGYLQTASTTELTAVAAPGVAGIFLVTMSGAFVGYRRAKVGNLIQTAGISRFAE
jgi:hypothetical protein